MGHTDSMHFSCNVTHLRFFKTVLLQELMESKDLVEDLVKLGPLVGAVEGLSGGGNWVNPSRMPYVLLTNGHKK